MRRGRHKDVVGGSAKQSLRQVSEPIYLPLSGNVSTITNMSFGPLCAVAILEVCTITRSR